MAQRDGRLIEAGPDLAGLSDIADVVKVSRQNMRKLAVLHFRSVPTPVHRAVPRCGT